MRDRQKITWRRRLVHRVEGAGARLFGPVLRFDRLNMLRFVPPLPMRTRTTPVWRRTDDWEAPESLRTVPGIWRDPAAEQESFERAPLHDFTVVHDGPTNYTMAHGWRFLLPRTGPRLVRALRGLAEVNERRSRTRAPDAADPAETTRLIRAEAARIGLSAVGFAPHDEKYTFAEHAGKHDHPTVIVCVLEQDWEATQTAPSVSAERAVFVAYGDIVAKMAMLATYVQELGHEVRTQSIGGDGIAIHYGVQAGLGQLGLNGQLLTPAAGSRARLLMMTTDANVVHDQPVDYGIHRICDECQLCVRRCPVGAIPIRRAEHRGVTKAKIKTERCFPVVARVHGCAVCMKVCPVQRYGLRAVTDHYVETGAILGKGSDELEGYRWPPDGRHYGPGSKPPVTRELLEPPGWKWSLGTSTSRTDRQRG